MTDTPKSPVNQEHFYTGAFLVSEAPGFLSRDLGVLMNAGTVSVDQPGGLVLSQNVVGTGTVATVGTVAGNGTLSAVSATVPGAFTIVATGTASFDVIDPAGIELAPATVDEAYAAAEVGFTIHAGTTAWSGGDTLTLTFPPGNGDYVPYTGAHPAAAILYPRTNVAASGTKPVTVITRSAEVNGSELQWSGTVTESESAATLKAAALAQLAAKGIVAR